jgi:hypothetical protein
VVHFFNHEQHEQHERAGGAALPYKAVELRLRRV